MEAKRLEANAHFKEQRLDQAAALYSDALQLYNAECSALPSASTQQQQALLEEFTKSAGNLCTCLHKLKRFEECVAAASRALVVNPFLAKCHAFLGMSRLDQAAAVSGLKNSDPDTSPALLQSQWWREEALQHLCRALWILPTMTDQLGGYLTPLLADLALQRRCGAAPAGMAAGVNSEAAVAVRDAGNCSGNGVFAVRSIPQDASLGSLLHPFSVAAYLETGGDGVCLHCARPNSRVGDTTAGVKCPRCQSAWFCSEVCSAEHTEQHALHECAPLAKLKEMLQRIEERQLDVPDDFAELAAHVITTRSAIKFGKPGSDRLMRLEHNSVQVSQALHPIPSLLSDIFPEEPLELLTRYLGCVRCNALEICDETGLGVGQALHLDGVISFFNHSCIPNCAIDHRTQTIHTIRTVREGEALTISYIPQLYWPKRLRVEGLADRYFFNCRCHRCESADCDPMEAVLTKTLPQSTKSNPSLYYHTVVQSVCSGIRDRPLCDVDRSLLDELQKTRSDCSRHLHATHYLFHDINNTVTFVSSVADLPDVALHSSLAELMLWEALIPGALPVKLDKVRNAALCMQELQQQQQTDGEVRSTHVLEPYLTAFVDFYLQS